MIKQHSFKAETKDKTLNVKNGTCHRIVLDILLNKAHDESMLSVVRSNKVINEFSRQSHFVPVNMIPKAVTMRRNYNH